MDAQAMERIMSGGAKAKAAGGTVAGKTVEDVAEPTIGGQKKGRGGKKKLDSKDKLIKNDTNFLFRFINQGYMLWNIVKKFTFKLLWNGSCFAFMFIMPIMFEVLTEQEAVLDKIQRDDMIAQAADFNPMGGAAPDQPIVRPF